MLNAFLICFCGTLGVSFGLLIFLVCFSYLPTRVAKEKKINDTNAASIAALEERNRLTKETNEILSLIAKRT